MCWVCGTERVLVAVVADSYRAHFTEVTTVDLAQDSQALMWTELQQLGPKRLVLVRHAERMAHWAPWAQWLKGPGPHALFVSEDPDLPHVSYAKSLIPELSGLGSRGWLVRCTRTPIPDIAAWLEISVPVAEHLLDRTGGLRRAFDVVQAARVLNLDLTPGVVDQLTLDPQVEFEGSLLALDKQAAYRAAQEIPQSEIPRVIGLLGHRLGQLSILNDLARRRAPAPDIARAGIPTRISERLAPIAKHYDPQRVRQGYVVLASADVALPGALEAVVALW